MRVVVPYTKIHPLTDRALRELAPDAERVELGRDDFAYGRLLERLWADREDVLIVEHDVELTSVALDEAINCDCWWSVAPYPGKSSPHREYNNAWPPPASLGCVRFRRQIMEAAPDAIAYANSVCDSISFLPGHWKLLDGRIVKALNARDHKPHQHSEVPHHHHHYWGCQCGKDH